MPQKHKSRNNRVLRLDEDKNTDTDSSSSVHSGKDGLNSAQGRRHCSLNAPRTSIAGSEAGYDPWNPRQQILEQEPIYFLKEELGRGGFGTIHKAVDVSTGDVHAAKKFHHDDWKKEVDILISLSHVSGIIDLIINPCLTFFTKEHIVKFVKFSEEQQLLLVMEYLPLGNLAYQACQHFITEEETLQILCQGLQALDYLYSYSPPLTHRDIKSINILV